MTTLVNGYVSDTITVNDRGLLYGDGVFETMLVVDGQVPFWSYHQRRLLHACDQLRIPFDDIDTVYQQIQSLVSKTTQLIVKVIVTRGEAARGYAIPKHSQATVIITTSPRSMPSADCWQQGVCVRFCDTQLALQPQLAGLKHLNRLEQILARSEWDSSAFQEGLMCTAEGEIIEATMHNVFFIKHGKLITPSLSQAGVSGIMRQWIIDYAQQNQLDIEIGSVKREQVDSMDELFLCNSVNGIWPVRQLEQQMFSVGPLTCQLRDHIAELLPYKLS